MTESSDVSGSTSVRCPCCSAVLDVAVVRTGAPSPGVGVPGASSAGSPGLALLRDREWLAGAYANRTAHDIAGELGCGSSSVYYWMRRHGIERRMGGVAPSVQVERFRERREAECVAALRAWAADNDGESPTQHAWADSRPAGAPSDGVLRDLFGSWNHALVAAGLKPRRPGDWVSHYDAAAAGKKPGRDRQMVTGAGLSDRLPGTVKHIKAA